MCNTSASGDRHASWRGRGYRRRHDGGGLGGHGLLPSDRRVRTEHCKQRNRRIDGRRRCRTVDQEPIRLMIESVSNLAGRERRAQPRELPRPARQTIRPRLRFSAPTDRPLHHPRSGIYNAVLLRSDRWALPALGTGHRLGIHNAPAGGPSQITAHRLVPIHSDTLILKTRPTELRVAPSGIPARPAAMADDTSMGGYLATARATQLVDIVR